MTPVKVLFVCHGNICRSPMAEFIFKNIARNNGAEGEFEVSSRATSREEIGNDIYPPAKRILQMHSIPFDRRAARQITAPELDEYDYVVAMDRNNLRNLNRLFGIKAEKATLLMEYAGETRDVSDPWYTGDFDKAYDDINKGCLALFKKIYKPLQYPGPCFEWSGIHLGASLVSKPETATALSPDSPDLHKTF